MPTVAQSVTVAAVQMCSTDDTAENLAAALALLREAAAGGARVVLLPENFALMARRDADRRALAEEDGAGPVQDALARAARELSVCVIAGSLQLRNAPGERVSQACLVWDERGERLARYDKIHLFDVDLPERGEHYRESAHMAPGRRVVTVDTPAGRCGLSICYDIRFPELYRALLDAGAEWFAVPAAFTVPTGEAHWHVLLRARAIENLGHVVAAAQSGLHANGRSTYGHSLVVDHWGRVLAERVDGPGVVLARVDRAAQGEARRTFPALSHRVLQAGQMPRELAP
jgi:deaminated glutathione amidase